MSTHLKYLCIALLGLLPANWLSAAQEFAWVARTGIPVPAFGTEAQSVDDYLNPSKTYDYQDDGATGAVVYRTADGHPYTYYVNPGHPSATNTNNPHGSPSTPRTSWPYPLQAGDCVRIAGTGISFTNGPSGTMVIGGTGTAANPIYLYGITDTEADMPQISRDALYLWGNYTIVERVRLANNCSVNTRPLLKGAMVQNVAVRWCRFIGTGVNGNPTAVTSGGSSGTAEGFGTLNFLIWGNVIRDYGNWQYATENDACGAILSQFCENAWLIANDIYHMGGDSVRIGADQGDAPSGRNYYIAGNEFHDNRENAIDVKQAINAVIADNDMYGFAASSSSGGEAVVIHYSPKNIWIYGNRIHDAVNGIYCSGIDDDSLWVAANQIWSISNRAIYPDRGGGFARIFGNTIFGCANGIISTGVIDGILLRNNIIKNVTGSYITVSDSRVAGGLQCETATAVGSVTSSGNASVVVTGAGITGSPLTLNVAVLSGDSASAVGGKIRTALAANSAITAIYNVSGSGASAVLTSAAAQANDTTLNISIANGTSGLTAAPTSANTVFGNPDNRATHLALYEESGAISVNWAGSTQTSVTNWINNTTAGDNSIEQDPLFADEDGDNFALTESSPARGAGANVAAMTFSVRYLETNGSFSTKSGTMAEVFGQMFPSTLDVAALLGGSTPDLGALPFDSDPPSPPTAITNLAAGTPTSTTIPLTWTLGTGQTSVHVEQSLESGTGYATIASLGSGATSYTVPNLTPGTTYYLRVRSTNADGTTYCTSPAEVDAATAAAVDAPNNGGFRTLLMPSASF